MDCHQARQLFDAYLDGELSPALATELGAHRLRCPACRQALALLEVTSHVIASDQEASRLGGDFEDRLLNCLDMPVRRWRQLRRWMYVAGPLAAAAVIGLAFLGFFDHRQRVAGHKVEVPIAPQVDRATGGARESSEPLLLNEFGNAGESGATAIDLWVRELQRSLEARRDGREPVKPDADQSILQLIDLLRSARDDSAAAEHFPGFDDSPASGAEDAGDSPDVDIEDL
ncbi:MAG TPA: zf-HC2 domain-containing protein [Phycisphaerae bacterium]|nr:zf-HC2 domain-containing protein [Phycisphaerae bacterium]HNU45191.1 zf-HC2 domain-containing protein [Phycisphaerae bacterium]